MSPCVCVAQGGCGACTVMISSYDAAVGKVFHRSVNACLAPLCSVDWTAVTTIEGIGSVKHGIHPVQGKRVLPCHLLIDGVAAGRGCGVV